MDDGSVFLKEEFICDACHIITHDTCGTACHNDLQIGIEHLVGVLDYVP